MLKVDPHSDIPPSRQIVRAVLDAIARGDLAAGDKLPSVRAAAAQALVNPNTIGKAWRELEHMGAVFGRNGAGVFVTDDGPALAQSARLATTLDDFARAARAALDAGHERVALDAALDAALERIEADTREGNLEGRKA